MIEPVFLEFDQVLYIQSFEAKLTNSPTIIRDTGALEAALAAPKATFGGEFLMDLFEMAAAYVVSLAHNHPFMDGNKRTALGAALSFLSINGFTIEESRDEELADLLLDFLTKSATKDDIANYFRVHSVPRNS